MALLTNIKKMIGMEQKVQEKQVSDNEDVDFPEETEEKDEAEGRASLEKYTSGKPKVEPPAEEKEPTEQPSAVKDSLRASMQLSGSPSRRVAQDTYYHSLQDFVDTTMKSIASKIAEKKSIELENSSLKILINKLRDDLKKEEQLQKVLQRNISQEMEVSRKREKDNADLDELLQVLREKTDAKKTEIDAKVNEAEEYYGQLKENVTEEKAKMEAIKKQIEEERVETRKEIKAIELAHAEAIGMYESLKKQVEHQKAVENERVKMLRQKSKLLAALIGQETLAGKSPIQKDISKILRSPLKQSMIMQSASKTLSKA